MAGLGLDDDRPEEVPERAAPVHYQISITGRQAGVFFLLLLLALGLSFFFGMKTGAAARRGPGAVATLASASDIPVPTLAPAENVREEKKPAEEPLGIKPEEKKAAAEEARKSAAPPSPVAAVPPTPVPPTPTPAPAPTPKPTAKPAPKGPFYVQILATKNAAAADELAKRLKSEGFNADVATIPGKTGWFRVHVGPFKDRSKAEATAKKIKATDKQIKNVPLVVP
jgi:cell division protein FtsN